MSSFRPISNLQFISKIIERVVSPQLVDYLMENKTYPNLQSAFTKGYSTETALLRVHNDLSEAMTIDHQILLGRLESRFGICDTALSWFQSYLTSRVQYVKINGKQLGCQLHDYKVSLRDRFLGHCFSRSMCLQ